jgi:hypothetical protein
MEFWDTIDTKDLRNAALPVHIVLKDLYQKVRCRVCNHRWAVATSLLVYLHCSLLTNCNHAVQFENDRPELEARVLRFLAVPRQLAATSSNLPVIQQRQTHADALTVLKLYGGRITLVHAPDMVATEPQVNILPSYPHRVWVKTCRCPLNVDKGTY